MRRAQTLIVGGGPAGAAAAIRLAQVGTRALLVERDAETRDALCGGFMSWETLRRLDALGVSAETLGAQRVDRVVLFAGPRSASAPLPAAAAGLSRRALDTALLARAAALGVGIERGVAVRGIDGSVARLGDGGDIAADRIVLATGKHELRGIGRRHDEADTAVGLRWRLGASPALTRLVGGAIELHLFRGGYVGLVMQEDGANLCLAVRRSRLAEADGRPERLLADLVAHHSVLAARVEAASAVGPPQAIANVPYGWRATRTADGLYRIGDQAGVIPSLAGEGIDIALASGMAAAEAIAAGVPAGRFQSRLARRLHRPIGLATGLWRLAEAPVGGRAMIAAVSAWPGIAGLAARLTRV